MRGWPAALIGALWVLVGHATPPEAVSADGRWRIRADGAVITLIDATGRPARTHVAPVPAGSGSATAVAVFDAAPRRSFVVAFETLPELWEISYDPQAEPLYQGLVHDYRQGEGIAEPGFLNIRRTKLDVPLRGLAFDGSHGFVLGRAPDLPDGRAVLHVVQLDVRKRIAEFLWRGNPDTAAARRVWRDGRELLEVPDRHGGATIVVDPRAARLLTPSPR